MRVTNFRPHTQLTELIYSECNSIGGDTMKLIASLLSVMLFTCLSASAKTTTATTSTQAQIPHKLSKGIKNNTCHKTACHKRSATNRSTLKTK